jgi:prolyl-tRNA editing enzyme YbaK/EbsC (Cys-tRNA(Pro) deacylase)
MRSRSPTRASHSRFGPRRSHRWYAPQSASEEFDFETDVHEFPEGTKTAVEAADAVGCAVAQIASSLVFSTPELVVVVTSGANRVSEAKLAGLCGVSENAIGMADAEAVRETIGWSIGGVPPFCHETAVSVYMDETLREFDTVWAGRRDARSGVSNRS